MSAETIPDDIVAKAGDLCKALGIPSTLTNCMPIVQAFVEERERCAGIAEYFAQACVCADWPDDARGASYYACGDIASAIRNIKPKQPSLPINDDDLPF